MKEIRFKSLWFLATLFLLFNACTHQHKQFKLLAPQKTGVDFANVITENDSLNILVTEFVYNGAGVAAGDLNNDGLVDLVFTGNQVENEIYLNKGQLQFENISESAGFRKNDPEQWSSGINLVDINLDGLLDIYICNTLREEADLRRNLLFVNQGNDAAGRPSFKEQASAYGLDDPSHASHAQFFDYDNDGDLDLFVGVNLIEEKYPTNFKDVRSDGTDPNRDNLLQNNWDKDLKHPVFKDVSLEAGILNDGYSHSTLVLDFNKDGWQDIYVANDYQSDDIIYINNQDGTFSNQTGEIFKHFSLSAMGSDIGDVNNDGLADIFTTEMQPYYNKRKKLFQGGSNYKHTLLTERFGYQYQYTRNTLQLNRGTNPNTGLPIFSEVGMYSKVQETDWSWATLFADFDNDGWQDLYVANGFPKDVTDHDFSDFRGQSGKLASNEFLLQLIPEIKSPNFLFKNKGGIQFENIAKEAGLAYPSFTNGAIYADLDNDGDLDIVTNNIDDPAFIFENQATEQGNYLRVKLKGPYENPGAIGAAVQIQQDSSSQKQYLISGRGYLSSPEQILHFGLGDATSIDRLIVTWANGEESQIKNLEANQLITIAYDKVSKLSPANEPVEGEFVSINTDLGIDYLNQEIDFVDFDYQRTLPHKFSQYGPSLAVGDVNGDGLEDVFLAASGAYPEHWLLQQKDGQFRQEEVNYKDHPESFEEDTGTLLFDADGDGDLDLYIARGGGQYTEGSDLYKDVLLLNDGNGSFSKNETAIPPLTTNNSCVKGADYDGDGDIDLFVGSRVKPFSYPIPENSHLLRNDSQNGVVQFVEVTQNVAPGLVLPGLVSDALWTDFDNDGWVDLLVAAEWEPIKIFKNKAGKKLEELKNTGIQDYRGWWNSLAALDVDNDGDMDYVAGNFGENLYFRCTSAHPLRVYGKDFDNNGAIDPLMACYWPDSLGNLEEYFYHPRQDMIKQLVHIRKGYNTYGEYGEATVSDMFPPEKMEEAKGIVKEANWMKTSIIENLGNGQFAIKALPLEAQLAPIYGIVPKDVNRDGLLDLMMIGNDHGMEVIQGRADAFNGLVLINKGALAFEPMSLEASQFAVSGAGIALVDILGAADQRILLASQNREKLLAFKATNTQARQALILADNEVKAKLYLDEERYSLVESHWGSTFMSQGSRVIWLNDQISKVEILDAKGEISRVISSTL